MKAEINNQAAIQWLILEIWLEKMNAAIHIIESSAWNEILYQNVAAGKTIESQLICGNVKIRKLKIKLNE
jgi:hypothetical protein